MNKEMEIFYKKALKKILNFKASELSTAEVIDLVNDYGYSEEEAKEIIEDENKLDDLFKEWLWETIETGYKVLKTDEEIEDWKGLND